MSVTIPPSQLTRLSWCCARCGKDDGVARSNIPLGDAMEDENTRRALLVECTRKVLIYHRDTDGCDATVDDIFYQPQHEAASPERIH
jgi:hypothetical protein